MTGDQDDFYARLKARMPAGWFGSSSPVLDALLRGIACLFSSVYAAYGYMLAQTRLQTSSDAWLDMAAADYFGTHGLVRMTDESDAAYRVRIQMNIVRERGTRRAVERMLTDLTGRKPAILEPARPADTGAYGGTASVSDATSESIASVDLDWQGPRVLYPKTRTNLYPYSATFSGNKQSSTINTFVQNAAPDGGTAVRVVPTASNVIHYLNNVSFGNFQGIPVSFSVFAKANGYNFIRVDCYDNSNRGAYFDLSTGVVASIVNGGNASVSAAISPLANGWYRCSVSYMPNVSTSVQGNIWVVSANGQIGFVADGVSGVLLYGAQFEASAVPTSYITTGASAVMRTDYVLSPDGTVDFAIAPTRGAVLSWTGSYRRVAQDDQVQVSDQVFATGDGLTTRFSTAPKYGYAIGYGTAGAYGSLMLAYQAFVTAYRPIGAGIPYVQGYGTSPGGYTIASRAVYSNRDDIASGVTDATINAAVASVLPAATIAWLRIAG
jgi:hypothetical protein